MVPQVSPFYISIAGNSGSGKTTLIENVISLLKSQELIVGVIKHTHHTIETDTPGKDTFRHRKAGASPVILASSSLITLYKEMDNPQPEDFGPLVSECNIVVVEGYKKSDLPKIEIIRKAVSSESILKNDPHVIAYISDLDLQTGLPVFEINEYKAIAYFIVDCYNRH